MANPKSDIQTIPFQGGMNTDIEKVLLPNGSYSEMLNMRNVYPGLEQRKGQKKHHSTASGSGTITIYQFSKGDRDEKKLYRQNVDGSVEQATDNPPTVTTGQFGSSVITMVDNPIPASWGNLNDKIIFSDGARQHQVNGGSEGRIDGFIVYRSSESIIPIIPENGEDYTEQVRDGNLDTTAILDDWGGHGDAFFILTPIRANTFNISMKNSNSKPSTTLKGEYWNDGWTTMPNFVDGTEKLFGVGQVITLSASGAITWDRQSDEIAKYQFGQNGYWYKFTTNNPLGSNVEINRITYGSKFQDIENIWSGTLVPSIEGYNFSSEDDVYRNYAASSITMDDFKAADFLYWNSIDPIEAAYIDVGATPNVFSNHDKVVYSFNGAGDFLSVPDNANWDFGSGDFAIDFWMKPGTIAEVGGGYAIYNQFLNTNNNVLIRHSDTGQSGEISVHSTTNSVLHFGFATSGAELTTSSWFHIALVRSGSTATVYVNGVDKGNSAVSGSMVDVGAEILVGKYGSTGVTYNGLIDELRISKGVPRFTADFSDSLPKGEYTSDSDTVLLIHCGETIASGTTGIGATFVDSGDQGHTVTENGNAIRSSLTYPFVSTVTKINRVDGWNGNGWDSASNLSDGTNGLNKTGLVKFNRINNVQKRQFQKSQYYSYWYRLAFDNDVSTDITISINNIPYFDINNLGRKGRVNAVWNERPVYTFNLFPSFLYIGARRKVNVLNGSDFNLLETGDGRNNAIVSMEHFGERLFVWQKEKGEKGGTTSIYSGTKPINYTKQVLSTKIGAFNAKSTDVVDGVKLHEGFFSDNRVEFARIAFWISQYGIMASDGVNIIGISSAINNYFDTRKPEVIRRGYEDEHWLKHDFSHNVLRVGLVSGGSATKPNVFLVYDVIGKTWGFDTLGQNLSYFTEVEADSGDVPILSVGAGTTDGFTYQTNTTDDDVDTAIDASVTMELDNRGNYFKVVDEVLRAKAQSAGNITHTIAENGSSTYTNPFNNSQTLSMVAKNSGEEYRRHKVGINKEGHHLSLKWRNNTEAQSMYLLDVGLRVQQTHKEN